MSLRVWLPLDGDLRNQGISNLQFTNENTSNIIVDAQGKIGSCYKRSTVGTSGRIVSDNTLLLDNDLSMCCWAKITATKQDTAQGLVTNHSVDTKSGFSLNVKQISTDDYRICCSTGNGSTRTYHTYYGTTNIKNAWHHLALTYDNTKHEFKLWVDGTVELTQSYTNSAVANKIMVFAWAVDNSTTTYYPACMLNDVRIYDHCLSAAEVKEIAQGLILHYKLDDAIGFTDLIARNTNITAYNNHGNTNNPTTVTYLSQQYNGDRIIQYSATPNSSVINNIQTSLHSHGIYNWNKTFKANTKYVFWIYYKPITHLDTVAGGTASNIGGWTEIPPVAVGGGWYRVGQYRNGTVTTDKTDNIFVSYKTPSASAGDNIIIWFASPHLLEGTTEIPSYDYPATIIQDNSGYNHNGTILGAPTISNDTIRYSNCMNFPTNTDGILSTFPLTLWNNAFTYSFWIKPSGENGGRSIYAASYNGVSCSIEKTTGNKLRFYWNGSPDLTTSSLTITDGVWQHIAIVKSEDKTKVYCYYNGELKDTFTNTFSDKTFSGNLRIARDTCGDATSYTGLMSDFRIYCTPLLDTDIKQLYNVGMKVDNFNNLHTEEIIEKNNNIFSRENVLKYRKAGASCEEIFYKNGKSCVKMWPAHFYKNITINDTLTSCILYHELKPNTQYVIDLWMDSSESTSIGGVSVTYDDGTNTGTALYVPANDTNGWLHRRIITSADKSVVRIYQRYGDNAPIYISLDSYIAPIDNLKIKKSAQVETTTIFEDYDNAKIFKSGDIKVKQIIER